MENEHRLNELLERLDTQTINLPLEFVFRVMKVLEIANNNLPENEQKELTGDYANTLYHEISNFFKNDEIADIEENNLLKDL